MTNNQKVYIVEAPVTDFCGIGAGGVHFAYGKAEVHEGWVLNWYKEHGYKVTLKGAATGFDSMKVDELKAYALDNGIELGEAKTKKEIIAVIEAAEDDKTANE